MHSYIRCKFALSLDNPTIMPYDEQIWANFSDSHMPVAISLLLIDALHARWSNFLRSLSPEQWNRTIVHPQNGPMSLQLVAALYSWHGRHHTAHITTLRDRLNW